MNDWLKSNAVSIAIALTTLVSTYAIYGYRIASLEAQVTETQATINTSDEVEVQIQISLAKLQTDMEYIKKAVDKLNN